MFGRLSWSAIPFDQPIAMGTGAVLGIVLLTVFLLVTLKGAWPCLWREWITSVDHKRIGIMYMLQMPFITLDASEMKVTQFA